MLFKLKDFQAKAVKTLLENIEAAIDLYHLRKKPITTSLTATTGASTAGMGAGIRHEWPDRLWTARTYPCGLPAHAFVAQPVEAMRQGRIRSGFESRRKHQRKQRRQRHPIRFERLPERERCYGRFSP